MRRSRKSKNTPVHGIPAGRPMRPIEAELQIMLMFIDPWPAAAREGSRGGGLQLKCRK